MHHEDIFTKTNVMNISLKLHFNCSCIMPFSTLCTLELWPADGRAVAIGINMLYLIILCNIICLIIRHESSRAYQFCFSLAVESSCEQKQCNLFMIQILGFWSFLEFSFWSTYSFCVAKVVLLGARTPQ